MASRVQSKSAEGNPASATFDATPTAGNLLVAQAFHRSNIETPTISGSGWTLVIDQPVNINDTNTRRYMAVWAKVAGASEPTNIQTNFGGGVTNLLLIQEFAPNTGTEFDLANRRTATANSNTTAVNEQSTGTTAETHNADGLIVGFTGHRNQQFGGPGAASWTNSLASNLHIVGDGTFGRTIQSAFHTHTTQSTKQSTASFSGSGGFLTNGAILVVPLVEPATGQPFPLRTMGIPTAPFKSVGGWN